MNTAELLAKLRTPCNWCKPCGQCKILFDEAAREIERLQPQGKPMMTCPKCGARKSPRGELAFLPTSVSEKWTCHSMIYRGKFSQTVTCRIRELEKEVSKLKQQLLELENQ